MLEKVTDRPTDHLIEACVDLSCYDEYFRVSGMQSSDACRAEQTY
jgi:hypothetical protein